MTKTLITLVVLVTGVTACAEEWRDWARYRDGVNHPVLAIKPADLVRARENAAKHAWAKEYVADLEKRARWQLAVLAPGYVEHMVPATTPGDRIFTPCPACRDQHKPYLPQGNWAWDENRPDELKCVQCGTVYPNAKYPETVELHAKWGGGQTLTFYGGDPFPVFNYKNCRPSFTGNLRSRQATYMADVARNLGEAYVLTNDAEFARGVRAILVRFADVYPRWMVHVGYGEYADMDPAVAAKNIEHLPADELVVPPNKPDRKLHTGYWSAGRCAGTGLEGYVLRRLVTAYDLTCGDGVWSDADRRHVERDLLLEATSLLTSDPAINNKSVTNRSAVAMVGMAVGEPGLVSWGLAGFTETVDHWFLPDGGTPESFAYGLMALNGLEEIALAARGYSDPADYRDAAGRRIDRLDLYRGTNYGKAWSVLYGALQGDLKFPPIADSYRTSAITPRQAELLAAAYPDRPEYLGLLRELCEPAGAPGDPSVAIYYRDPQVASRTGTRPRFVDGVTPDLRIGMLRTGDDGRESLVALNASDWGNHHHQDSLGLYYWKGGQELLSDLGYLWDHPDKHMTGRTFAHNVVVIDEADQVMKNRGGTVRIFATSPHAKAVRASSAAYAQARTYERTVVLVDHGEGRSYVVDCFRVEGGKTQDYVFHGPCSEYRLSEATASAESKSIYDLTQVQRVAAEVPWRITFRLASETEFTAWSVPQEGEAEYVGAGWGQRDYKNSDVGATLPYVVRRCQGRGERKFVSVFESHPAKTPFVGAVAREGSALIVRLADGAEDRVTSTTEGVTVESRRGDRNEVLLRATAGAASRTTP